MARYVINPNGTVPVKFAKFYGGYGAGEVAGFEETTAKNLVDVFEVASFVDADGQPIVDTEDAEDAADAAQIDANPVAGADIEIPADWRDKHHLSRMALAAKISGAPVPNDEAAIAVIEAELARRSGAA